MSQAAKAQEPSMEEILASIRRIIADDEGEKRPQTPPASGAAPPAPAPVAPPPRPPEGRAPLQAVPPPEPGAMSQADIDSMLADFDRPEEPEPIAELPAHAPDDDVDVLELTEAMEAKPTGPDSFRTIDASPDVVFNETAPPPRPAPRAHDLPERMLLSDHATASVASAFGSLAHTVLAQNARTLDDLVKEMLRPMLKTWLDDNLPTIVERLVRAEIERVSRGR